MAFRTSTLPDWTIYERDGFFATRSPRFSEVGPTSPEKLSSFTAMQEVYNGLPKDLQQAEYKVKLSRLILTMKLACGWQIVLLILFSVLFTRIPNSANASPLMYYTGFSYLHSAVESFIFSVVSVSGLALVALVYFTVFTLAICLNSQENFAESIHEQISRYTSLRILLKPLCFGLAAWLHCFIFLLLFDQNYQNLLLVKEISEDTKVTYLHENLLVVRLAAAISGFEFFFYNFTHRGFRLEFPSTRVKWGISSLLCCTEVISNVKGSLHLSIAIWVSCLLFGPLFYFNLFTTLGIELFQSQTFERFLLFLDVTFMIRVFLWVYIPRLTFRLYLILVNSYFTEIINLPIEYPPKHNQCLLLSDAMKGNNAYMKSLAFYEFKIKSRVVSPDVMVFYNITHPGSHPINWKGVFNSSCQVLTEMNESTINFLKTAKLPPTLLQAGFQPSVLNQLRQFRQSECTSNQSEPPRGVTRFSQMRDLTSPYPHEVPKSSPTVMNLIKQIPSAVWNDISATCRGYLTMQNLNSLLFFGKLDVKLPEKQIANIFSLGMLSFWALEGTLELICISVERDPRGVVHQDLRSYIVKVVETYDTLSVLDYYMTNTLEREMEIDRSVFEESKIIVTKLINASIFVLSKVHCTFAHCYNILDVDEECRRRVEDIICYSGIRP